MNDQITNSLFFVARCGMCSGVQTTGCDNMSEAVAHFRASGWTVEPGISAWCGCTPDGVYAGRALDYARMWHRWVLTEFGQAPITAKHISAMEPVVRPSPVSFS